MRGPKFARCYGPVEPTSAESKHFCKDAYVYLKPNYKNELELL